MLQYFTINKQELKGLIASPIAPRQRGYHEIMWVQKGATNFLIDGDSFSVQANAFFIFPKDRIHQFLPKQVIEGQVIRFSEDLIDDFPRLLFSKFNPISEIKIEKSDNKSLELLFKLFRLEYDLHTEKSLVITNLLKTIIYKLDDIKQKQFPCQKAHHYSIDSFDQFQLLLDNHILEHKKVNFYAEKLNITPRKLGETVRSILNKTTTEVISNRLLIECKRQLIYSNNSITEIAYELGFEDNSYFTKFFKKLANTTPKKYRERANIA
tara:strand:- start:569 stop:1369 length:801 start_codon:yes stop_codon:yes gene_type:complete